MTWTSTLIIAIGFTIGVTAPACSQVVDHNSSRSNLSSIKKCPAGQTYSMKAKGCLPVKPGKKK